MTSVRGDIYRLRAPKASVGHEQQGQRYVVVLQSNNLLLSTLLVAPTSTRSRSTSFRPEVTVLSQRTKVLVEQTTVIDPELRLGDKVGRLSPEDLSAVDDALSAVFGLWH